MISISELVLPAAQQVVIYGKKLLQDISPEMFARKPQHGGQSTEINHPAFQYGHLGLYPSRIGGLLNLPMDSIQAPQGFPDLFKIGSPCLDDPTGAVYPSMPIITEHFFRSHEALFEILKKVPDEAYFQTNVDERSKERYPIVGSFVIYILTAHANTHFGQVSAWRRSVGLKGVS